MTQQPRELSVISRKLLIRGVVVAVLGLCLAVGYHSITGSPWRWEPLLHAIGCISKDEAMVMRELQSFERLVKHVVWDCEDKQRMPPDRLADYFSVNFPDKAGVFGKSNRTIFKYLESGVDPWGTEFVFNSVVAQRGENQHTLYITLRSSGANGIDEDGEGDDRQRVIEQPFYLEPPPWAPNVTQQAVER